jgi:transmembrane sensor
MMTPEKFKSLLAGYYAGALTDKEKLELSALLHDQQYRQQLEQLFNENLADPGFKTVADAESLELMYQHIQLQKQPAPVRRMFSFRSRWIAAAAIILLVATGAYFLLITQSEKPAIVQIDNTVKNDVAAPAYTKAVLLLGDGNKIIIDSAPNGLLALQGNISITKTGDGQLVYSANAASATTGSPSMNTLTVPKGSRPLQLILTDGTKIWLNAASSITYPTVFAGNAKKDSFGERKVQMSGEAYYEVAKEAGKKFHVSANGIITEVLGTQFNINAYEDETNVKITLLEGGVKVSTIDQKPQTLSPGQQAQWKSGDKINVDAIDIDEAVAWKDGFFDFRGTDIQAVMRQLARWYNVEVEYKGKISDNHFSGIINRNNNISQVLKMLQSTGGVRFEVETGPPSASAGKIIVLP